MNWYVNLHQLPAGSHLYTALVCRDDYECDEIEFVASSRLDRDDLTFAAATCDDAEGYDGCSIVGMIDQSDGYVIWQ